MQPSRETMFLIVNFRICRQLHAHTLAGAAPLDTARGFPSPRPPGSGLPLGVPSIISKPAIANLHVNSNNFVLNQLPESILITIIHNKSSSSG